MRHLTPGLFYALPLIFFSREHAESLQSLRTPEGEAIPPNTLAEQNGRSLGRAGALPCSTS